MSIALCLATSLLRAGQTSTQMLQPVQSSGATWIVIRCSERSAPFHGIDLKPAGGAGERRLGVGLHADRRVRADEGAEAALDADRLVPDRDLVGDATLLPAGRADGEGPVDRQGADGEQVAPARDDHARDALHEVGRDRGYRRQAPAVTGCRGGDGHPGQTGERCVDRAEVAVEHRLAGSGVVVLDRALDARDRLLGREEAGQGEEAHLHHRVDAAPEPGRARDAVAVDHVEAELLGDDLLLHLDGEPLPDLFRPEGGVQEEGGASPRALEHVDALQKRELVAGDEAGFLDQIRALDRLRSEAQVRDGDRTGLLRVVDEVALGVEVGLGADDLHRALRRANGAVRAEPVEDGARDLVPFDRQMAVPFEAQVRHVVDDAEREAALGVLVRQLVEDRDRHGGRELLRGQAVAASDHSGHLGTRFGRALLGERHHDVLVQRLAEGAGLLRAVEDRDRACRWRDGRDELPRGEGPKQADDDVADLVPLRRQPLAGLAHGAHPRAHQHDHAVGFGVPVVLDRGVVAAGALREAPHGLREQLRDRVVERIGGLARLEEHVGVLGAAPQHGAIGVQRARAVGADPLVAYRGRVGRRRTAARSSTPRATSGSRRRSAGREHATRA